jgi:hypothetical protein
MHVKLIEGPEDRYTPKYRARRLSADRSNANPTMQNPRSLPPGLIFETTPQLRRNKETGKKTKVLFFPVMIRRSGRVVDAFQGLSHQSHALHLDRCSHARRTHLSLLVVLPAASD